MKKYIITCVLVHFGLFAISQRSQEWTNQKATQKKYLLQQIAALQIYMGYLRKGYNIAKNGLETIHDIKKGHFKLDENFFSSLKHINPYLKGYSKVLDIVKMNIIIFQRCKTIVTETRQNSALHNEESIYITSVTSDLGASSSENTDYLKLLITEGKLSMTDDERLTRIDRLYEDELDKFVFINTFMADIDMLCRNRNKELKDASSMRLLYGK